MAIYTIRLDEESEEALASLARGRQVSRAVVLREAIAEYAGGSGGKATPLSRLSSLVGVIEDGPRDLSKNTGRSFAALLESRAKPNRPKPQPVRRAARGAKKKKA